ncbi:MAG: MPN family protein [Cenarchaeum symbiont of Oopsacas minuta]|nr:MPN family protein [Cenarchaeum symbiont of Oopsacas minuta]
MDECVNYSRIKLIKRILLRELHTQKMIDYAKSCLPNESCAMLLGSIHGECVTVKEVILAENTDASTVKFSINPDQVFNTYAKAKKYDLDVVGIFHSHPTSEAKPSETDKKFMLINPSVWLIYSEINKELAAYGLDINKNVYSVEIFKS